MSSQRISYIFFISIITTIFYFAYSHTPLGSVFKIVTEGLIISLFLFSIFSKKGAYRCPLLKLWGTVLIILLLVYLIIPYYAQSYLLSDTLELFIPFAVTYSSYKLFKCDDKNLIKGLAIISLVSIFVIPLILKNTGGFEIMEMYRSDINKNQTAPFFAQIGLIAIALSLSDKLNLIYKIIFIITALLSLAYCSILSARTATLAFILIGFFLIWEKYKLKVIVIIPLLMGLLFVFGEDITAFFNTSIIGNRDITNLDSLTSGRFERAEDSMAFIIANPLFGALNYYGSVWQDSYEIPHIYLLWKILKYGIIGALPFCIIYAAIAFKALSMLKNWKKYELPLCCLIVAFFTSFSEYSSPFGPGSSYILCYILFGHALSIENSSKHEDKS